MGDHDDDRFHQGMEHVQAAAREMIEATRTLLDAAEELLDDPRSVQDIVTTLTSVVQAAAAHFSPPDASTDDGKSQVERIEVS